MNISKVLKSFLEESRIVKDQISNKKLVIEKKLNESLICFKEKKKSSSTLSFHGQHDSINCSDSDFSKSDFFNFDLENKQNYLKSNSTKLKQVCRKILDEEDFENKNEGK